MEAAAGSLFEAISTTFIFTRPPIAVTFRTVTPLGTIASAPIFTMSFAVDVAPFTAENQGAERRSRTKNNPNSFLMKLTLL
jgi:hypothetical protein